MFLYKRHIRVEDLPDVVADLLAQGEVIGLHSRGAWSLGHERWADEASLATPVRLKCNPVMNLKIKYRESFRPFAPSVLRERVCGMV